MEFTDILVIVISLILIYVMTYLKSNAKKMGEIDASLSKIEEITKMVERIKSEIKKENSQFRSNLEIQKTNRLDIISEEKRTIEDFLTKIHIWKDRLLNEDYYVSMLKNSIALLEYRKEVDKKRTDVVEYLARVNLYINDNNILIISKVLIDLLDKFDVQILSPYIDFWKIINNPLKVGENHDIKKTQELFLANHENFVKGDYYNVYMKLSDLCKNRITEILK